MPTRGTKEPSTVGSDRTAYFRLSALIEAAGEHAGVSVERPCAFLGGRPEDADARHKRTEHRGVVLDEVARAIRDGDAVADIPIVLEEEGVLDLGEIDRGCS